MTSAQIYISVFSSTRPLWTERVSVNIVSVDLEVCLFFSCVGIVTVISVWLVYCVCSSHRDPSLLSDCRYDSETADVSRIELHTETPCSRIPLSRPCEESRLCDEKRFLFLVLVCVWFDFPQGKWLKRLVTCQLVTEQLSASWSLTLKASTRREPFQAFSILAC